MAHKRGRMAHTQLALRHMVLVLWAVVAAEKQPDLLLLMGPFVDAKHPCLEAGNIPATFEEVFQGEVRVPGGVQHPRDL